MKRRNAILAAVGLNVGLLALLFATATKNGSEKKEEERFAAPRKIEERPVPIARQLPPPPPPIPLFQEEEEQQQIFEVAAAPAETVAEQVVASSPAATVQVVVKKGDALEKIARAHGTSVEEIMRVNKMSSTRLQIGQVLKVPPKQQKNYPIAEERAEQRSEAMEEFYVVKSGDSPWTIAAKNHMSVEALLSLNELDEQKAKRLKAGDRLRIR